MKKNSNIPHLARAAMLLLVAMLTSMAAWATDVTYTYTCSVYDRSEMRMGSSNSMTVTVGSAWNKNQPLTFTNDKISITTKAQIGHNGTYFCMKPKSSDAFTFTISSTDNTWYIKKVTVKYNYNGSSTVSSKTVAGLNVHTLDVSTGNLAANQDNYLQGFEVELTDQPYYSVTPAEGLQIATSADAFAYNDKTYFHDGATVAIVPESDVHVITATDGTVNDATIADNKRSFSFSMPAQDITPSATLEEAHTVTLSGNVSITDPLFEFGGNRYYKSGDQITITAANTADIIDQISGISDFAIADNRKSATFTMPTSDLTLAATTSEVYTVKFPSSVTISEPYITIDNTKYYKADETYTLTVANADHIIDAINGVIVNYSDDLKSATFKMPHGYLTITYAGTYKPYTVTIPDYLTVSVETASPVIINGIDYYKTDDQITLTLADDDPNNVINTLTATGAESSSIATDRRSVNITVGTQDITVSTTFLTIGGTCGDGLTWQMTDTDKDGTYETLTISGSGAIAEYADGNAPWYADHAAHITRVNIGDQITTIPGNPFYGINADIVLSTPARAVQYKEASFANAIRVPFGNFLFHATDESGTPAYAITDEQDLRNLAAVVNAGTNGSGKTFYQTADITMSTNKFTPIGNNQSFYGTYDGGNHAITGLNATTNYYAYSGLFGKLFQATVQNIILVNPTATATDKSQGNVGAIAGCGEHSPKVSNCHVINPTVSATNTDQKAVGAIIGLFQSGSVSNCYFYDSNADHNYPTVGKNNGGTITNVSAAHTITLADDYVTTTATPAFSYLGTDYYAEGTITLSHTERTDGTVLDHYTVNGEAIDGNSFKLNADATVSATWKTCTVIDGNSDNTVSLTAGTYANIIYKRNITAGIPTTIMLPFNFEASSFNGGKFYSFSGINTETWEATMTSENEQSTLSANTPYIYIADEAMTEVTFSDVTIDNTTAGKVEQGDWTFQGTYERKVWNPTGSEITTTNVYGFAAKSGTNQDNETYAAGEFVRARRNVSIKPTRAYLEYTGEDNTLSKSALVLPDRISVVFIDKETASVIDDPSADDPNTGDITTPVSELTPTLGNVNVWSYDHTIYIAAAPGIDYRIIDANGRTLRAAATLTDRDEIRLGSHGGIAIVIINNKTYKVIY